MSLAPDPHQPTSALGIHEVDYHPSNMDPTDPTFAYPVFGFPPHGTGSQNISMPHHANDDLGVNTTMSGSLEESEEPRTPAEPQSNGRKKIARRESGDSDTSVKEEEITKESESKKRTRITLARGGACAACRCVRDIVHDHRSLISGTASCELRLAKIY